MRGMGPYRRRNRAKWTPNLFLDPPPPPPPLDQIRKSSPFEGCDFLIFWKNQLPRKRWEISAAERKLAVQ